MAGFNPVGSTPVGSIGGTAGPSGYTLTPAAITYGGYTPSITYTVTSPPKLTWIGTEILRDGAAGAQLFNVGTEVLHVGTPASQLMWLGVEVLVSTSGPLDSGWVSMIWGQ